MPLAVEKIIIKNRDSKTPTEDSVRSINRHGYHQVAYLDWTSTEKAVGTTTVCVHGLTRNGHDFDPLARILSDDRRVICPDLPGRGRSGRLPGANDYNLLQYNLDISMVFARLGDDSFDFIGTSLGGMIGIVLAAMDNSPIRRLVVNDIAPEIPSSAARRVTGYLDRDPVFPDLEAVEQQLRTSLAPFGPMTDADWQRMARTSVVETAGGFQLSFDPAIAENFRRYWLMVYFNLWHYWEKIRCPVLILRGKESDFLTERLRDKMIERLPHADVIEFDDVGHTPTLNAPIQTGPLQTWLDKP